MIEVSGGMEGKGDTRAPVNEMATLWIESIGLFAGVLGVVAWVPQIKEVWILKKHEGISIPTFGLVATALVAWLIYGILVKSPQLLWLI